MLEDGNEVVALRDLRRSLVPTDKLDVANPRPLREEKLEGGRGARVDGEGVDGREAEVEAESEEGLVIDGEGGEEGVAPRGEEGEIEVGDGSEAAGEEVEVTRVAAESEVGAGGSLEGEELVGDEGEGVAGS